MISVKTQTAAPIRRKLMTVLLMISGVVMLTTSLSFCAYDFITYRQRILHNLVVLGETVAANTGPALASGQAESARDILSALKAERHVVEARLNDSGGNLLASYYPAEAGRPVRAQPLMPDGYRFQGGYLWGVQPVFYGSQRVGTLYLKADLDILYQRLTSFGLISLLILGFSYVIAYLLADRLQRQISEPILGLAKTMSVIAERHDYTGRAAPQQGFEFGQLTDAFNTLLTRVERGQARLQSQLGRMDLLHRITRAKGERQDLPSIFQVVLRSLEDELPIDFGCMCLYESDLNAQALSVATIGARSREYAAALSIDETLEIPIDRNGLARCVTGELVYEPDVSALQFPFPQRFARAGLLSIVLAPLIVQKHVFGVLVVARRAVNAFDSTECEFLRHLSEHVALASHQAKLHTDLKQAYEDLRQSQQSVLQQERLRALGQMASGIAHDINNAISPISLYTESLLEREPGLSERTRNYLVTIQRAIEDVAETVARMRDFYRTRQPDLNLARVGLNRLVSQVVELTRARWSDLPLQKGVVISLITDLSPELPDIMGSEAEIRDALTNLVFNAADAMPEGGTLTLRTRVVAADEAQQRPPAVAVEVIDTGTGMDEETRRRCLEPFFTTKGERGTGLGLAMVYGMIQRHSAELEIDSTPGEGTTVRLLFAPAQQPIHGVYESTARDGPRERLRLLLVDDDPLIIKSLREVLRADGHTVVVADGGKSGIHMFQAAQRSAEPFSLVITDLGMPYVDGRKVAAAIKLASPDTPVIMLTGWGRRLLAENDIPANVDRVLSKPPKLGELRAALAELTRRSGRSTNTAGTV